MAIPITFYILSLIWYIRRKYSLFILGLSILLSNLYYFVPSNPGFNYMSTALIITVTLLEFFKNQNFFSSKNDKIGKIVLLLIALFTLNCIITILLRIETSTSALKVLYNNLFLVSYFIFRKFDIRIWEKSLNYILPCTVIGGICYYLQFLGIHLLSGIINEGEFGQVEYRYMNYPVFTYLFLFYFLFANIKHKYLWLAFFTPFIILPMSRGSMLGVIITVFVFLYIKKKLTKYVLKIAIPIILALLVFYPIIMNRFAGDNNKVHFIDEISNMLKWKSYTDFNNSDSDTYAFRIALIWEKLDYMFAHPQTLILGNGSIYENTKACQEKFDFLIGSLSIDKNGDFFVRQIDSTDVAFITHFFRYGILYIVLIVLYLSYCYKRFNIKNNIWADVALLFLLFSIIRCTVSSPFYDFSIHRMFPLLLFSGIIRPKQQILCKIK